MDVKNMRNITYIVNTIILLIVLIMTGFFYFCKATFLVYFSIPTICVYLLGYFIIYHEKLYFYVILIFSWITLYMSLTTVCLGYKYGFQLYALSLIPIIYYVNYLAYKMKLKRVSSAIISIGIAVFYFLSIIYSLLNGPIYQADDTLATIVCCINSISVLGFLITYTKIVVNTIIYSEEELVKMSYTDKLTGLYNRHYMAGQLEEAIKGNDFSIIAIMDIDDFKKINDEYGHNAGDYVLQKISKIMKEECKDVILSRWGGEEFLILINKSADYIEQMEKIRKTIENEIFEFEGQRIKVSVTIGVSERSDKKKVNKWIQAADDRLYVGKNKGKNVVVFQ